MNKPFEPFNGYCQDCPPPVPCDCPDMPKFCPPPKPGPGPCVPPAPSVIRGMDLYEAMEGLTDRVNTCIHTYNDVMANCYGALRNIQCAAEQNGSYYGPCEVWTEEGYNADEGAKYVITHKAACDLTGAPIEVELQLAYNSTTNSGVTQDCFSASEVTFADKMFAAIPVGIPIAPPEGETWPAGWYGNVFYKGAPLPSISVPTLYTCGFTRNGFLRAYSNSVSQQQFKQDCIVNSMGCSGILALNGQLTDESYRVNIPNSGTQTARILIGQNYETREVIFLATGNQDNPGMTSVTAANVLLGYGCTVVVELCEGDNACALDKGQMQIIPTNDDVPQLYAYWFISRRRHYKNRYQKELAELAQEYGHCIWQIYLSKLKVDGFDARLKKEIADRIAADEALQQQITANDADIAALQERTTALETSVTELNNRVTAVETTVANLKSQVDLMQITIDQHSTDIATLQTKVDNLQTAMTALNNSVLALQTAVTDLQTQFSEVLTQFREVQNQVVKINQNIGDWDAEFPTTTITQEVKGIMNNFSDYLPLTGGTLSGPLYGTTSTMGGTEYGKNKITAAAAASEFQIQLDANNTLTYSADSLDVGEAKVQGVQTPVADTDAANKKYVDDAISGGITPPTGDYLPLSGGQMKGSISMGTTYKVTDLAAPTADSDAATKAYVDSHTPTGDYLPLSGGTLTGNLTMGAGSKITGVVNPTDGADAANKTYVDSFLPLTGGSLSGNVTMTGGAMVTGLTAPATDTDAANKAYVDSNSGITQATADGRYLQLTGGTLTGALNIGETEYSDALISSTKNFKISGPNTQAINVNANGVTLEKSGSNYAVLTNDQISLLPNGGGLNITASGVALFNSTFNANGTRITGVASPSQNNDAMNLGSLKTYGFMLESSSSSVWIDPSNHNRGYLNYVQWNTINGVAITFSIQGLSIPANGVQLTLTHVLDLPATETPFVGHFITTANEVMNCVIVVTGGTSIARARFIFPSGQAPLNGIITFPIYYINDLNPPSI